jgi:hypothetical protein
MGAVQGEEVVQLELLKTDSYDDVSKALATKLGLDDPLKLRLTGKPDQTCFLK